MVPPTTNNNAPAYLSGIFGNWSSPNGISGLLNNTPTTSCCVPQWILIDSSSSINTPGSLTINFQFDSTASSNQWCQLNNITSGIFVTSAEIMDFGANWTSWIQPSLFYEFEVNLTTNQLMVTYMPLALQLEGSNCSFYYVNSAENIVSSILSSLIVALFIMLHI